MLPVLISAISIPAELYLPDPTFRIFPFIRLLQWPSEDDISERSLNGKFLVSMGVKPVPELLQILRYVSSEVPDGVTRLQCLDFVANRLGSGGTYQLEYSRLSRSDSTCCCRMRWLQNSGRKLPQPGSK